MGKPRKSKKPKPITARPQTEIVQVHSPNVPGAIDRPERVIDSIDYLRKKFPLEFSVASRIRRAHDLLSGSIGGVSDYDRVRGRGIPGMPPHISYINAANIINTLVESDISDVGKMLVGLVVCDGKTLGSISRSKQQREHYGAYLRTTLREIADFWGWSENRSPSPIRGFRTEALTTDIPLAIEQGRVVHATGHRIFRVR